MDDSTEKLTSLYNEKAKTVTQEAQKELDSWKKLYDEQVAELEDARRAAARQLDDRAVAEARVKSAEAVAKALSSRATFAQEVRKALQLPAEERLAANEALRKRAASLLKQEAKASALQSERISLQKKHLRFLMVCASIFAVEETIREGLNCTLTSTGFSPLSRGKERSFTPSRAA